MTTHELTLGHDIDDLEELAAQSVRSIEALAARSVREVRGEAGAVAFAIAYLLLSLVAFSVFAPAVTALAAPGGARAVPAAAPELPCELPDEKPEPVGMCLAH